MFDFGNCNQAMSSQFPHLSGLEDCIPISCNIPF